MSLERYAHNEITPWTGEHIHRYIQAKGYLNENDVVLDLACGTGYGADILSKVKNTNVYGGDIEETTITDCKRNWNNNPSLHFEVMDGTQLLFSDHYFDKVVSLETIEHLTAYQKMVSEFSRVLKQDGIAIISTPNIKISSPDGIVRNPYHTQEFTYDELYAILKENFSDVKIYGQKYTRYFTHQQKRYMYAMEKFLLFRGIRKLPYHFRDSVFNKAFDYSLYPTADDFQLFSDKVFIEQNCHVLFAICKR